MVYHFLKKLYRSPIVIHHSLRKVFIHNLGPLDKESPGMWHRVSAGSCWQALCTHIYAQKPPALFPSLAFTNLGVKLCRSEVGRGLCSLELCMTGLGMVATGWSAPGRRAGIRGPWVSGVSCLSPNPLATWVFSSSCHSANHKFGCTDNRWEGLSLKTTSDEHSLQLYGQPPVHYCNVPSLERDEIPLLQEEISRGKRQRWQIPYSEILWDWNPLFCHSVCTDRPPSALWWMGPNCVACTPWKSPFHHPLPHPPKWRYKRTWYRTEGIHWMSGLSWHFFRSKI